MQAGSATAERGVASRRGRRLWSWLKAHAWLVRLVVALVAAALALWGLARQRNPLPWPERLYTVLQLFVLETPEARSPFPAPLTAARFLAAAVAASAVWSAVALLFAERFARLRVRWFVKDHVVVCGLGEEGALIAQGFRRRGDDVVGVDLGRPDGTTGAGVDGAIVLAGDATHVATLTRAGVGKARLLVVCCGDDRINAEVAATARSTVASRRRRPLTCLVHVADPDLSALLTESQVANPLAGTLRLDFFDPVQRGVVELMRGEDTFGYHAERGPHLLVVGLGHVGRSIVVHAARAWHVVPEREGRTLRITAVDLDAEAKVADLCHRYPGLSRTCEIEPWTVDVTSAEFEEGTSLYKRDLDWPFSRVYVCMSDEARSIGAALVVRRRLPGPSVPIVVRTSRRGGLARLLADTEAGPFEHMRPFDPREWMSRPQSLLAGPTETIARALHEQYLRNRQAAEGTDDGRSVAPWEDLPEDLRESNRRLARQIGEKMRAVGCRLQPLWDWHVEPVTFAEEEVERLARMEHEAWREERTGAAWTYAATKDVERRRSPYLVPWEELPPDVQDIDRALVRALPEFLASTGFAVIRTVTVGVTGHRVLTDVDKLARGVDEAIRRIEATHPGRPVTVLSALAEGADRLVARRILTRPGSRLVAALPLPAEDYVQDFATETGREEFARLLAQAEEVVELPPADTREESYEKAGRYVIDHCDVLVAVWDGEASQGRGGTADVVALARRRRLPLAWVRAGNRRQDTAHPTSLGDDQGLVTFERL
ncbi:MAG TPA: NAD-binding protein [Acidimicrobiales bacterium]|nr:NAD-binding protein [Acidimicrobiales bacterium]